MVFIPCKLKNILKDTVLSIAGLVMMNVAAQFIVYPYWNRVLGTETYGNIVYLLGVMNVLAISLGIGVNYTRMKQQAGEETKNGPYLLLMAVGSGVALLILFALQIVGLLQLSVPEFIFFCILTIATMWRYYADVEYRLNLNYKGLFLFYFVIGVGYLAGILLFNITGLWPLALLLGEVAGLAIVAWQGSVFQRDSRIAKIRKNNDFAPILHISFLLIGLNLLSHLVFNGDRIILQLSLGGTAVSIYYISSLFGKAMTLLTTPLNGVLVGHLTKYDGKLTMKMMNQVTKVTVVTVTLATMGCVAASVIILPILYPSEFESVRQYLLLANAAQVIYFVGNVITVSIIFRFTPLKNQLIINIAHGVLFVTLCIPATLLYKVDGFCISLLFVNTIRLILSLLLGYRGIWDGA